MILFVSIVHIVVCLMLVGIILLQPGKGMGLTNSSFSDSAAQSVFGTKTADVLTKATTVAAVLFMVTCVSLSALTARKSRSLYSNFKNQAPITMDQIQKAVKEAEQKKSATDAVSDTAQKAVDAVVASAATTLPEAVAGKASDTTTPAEAKAA